MLKFVFCIVCSFIIFSELKAQVETVADSIMLQEVTATAIVKKYQAGAKIETIPQCQLQLVQEGSIGQALTRFAPVYIKSDAGGLSTIHLRGTSASHTTVNFGGININSLTLGQSNMSAVPVYLFDNIDLQYGSSSAVNGSGSVGGALTLGMQNNWTDGAKIGINLSNGSFGEQFYGTKIFAGNGHWETVSRGFIFKKENNFPFKNPYTGQVENREPINDRQHGASVNNFGIVQELNYLFKKDVFIKSAIWIGQNRYEVQPNMATNLHFKATEEIDNKHIRTWSEYQNNKHQAHFKGGLGYVHEMQVFNNDKKQKIGTDRAICELTVDQDITTSFGYKAGAKYQYIVPDVYAYPDSVISYEQHLETYFSSFFTFRRRLKATLNLRQMFVTRFSVPFTPSFGTEYRLNNSETHLVKLSANVASSYRVPTFNDRYWGIQGNPNLKPEDGINYELGIDYLFVSDNFKSATKLNGFFMNVKNWIEWRNFGVWQAQNVKEVVSKGIEIQSSNSIKTGKVQITADINYSYNPVEAVKDISETGIVGRQLIYTPKHRGSLFLMAVKNNWQFTADGSFTGARLSDDFGNRLDPYWISNLGIIRKISWHGQSISISGAINNLFDTNYQNERYYAMPGRSFRVGLSINFNIQP